MPQRQADRHRRPEHGHGHARREADRREDGRHARRAGPVGRAAAPDRRSGGREEGRGVRVAVCRPVRAAPAARSSSPRPTPWRGPSRARRSSWSAKRPTPRTSKACGRPQGILTARGGMTSHAALVARGWGKCCIVGAGDHQDRTWPPRRMTVGGSDAQGRRRRSRSTAPGAASTPGALEMMDATENPRFQEFMKIVDKFRTLGVRTNADTPEDAKSRPRASAPRASACSAPSTCSTARAPTSRCSCCGR